MSLRGLMMGAIALAAALDLLANYLAAHYLVPVGPFLVPGGSFVFALSFTIYDFLRRQFGLQATLAAVILGFLASMLYNAVWGGGVGRIAVAGLVALAFSSTTDVLVQTVTIRWPLWRYVTVSNAVSLLIDSIVFVAIAFAALPLAVRIHIMEGQFLVKLFMTLVSIPLVYVARLWADWLRFRPRLPI